MRLFDSDRERISVAGLLVLLAAAVFFFQPAEVLFGPGHIGWVSSHTLAIIRNATLDRWFLGFTCEFAGGDNYKYFDRYPVLFSGTMHLLLHPFKDNFADYISWARTYMNVIYMLSIITGYHIALLFTKDRLTALLATTFTFMGVFFVFYKDMIHFDQPAVLGVLLLFYAIAKYEIHGDKRWIWPAAAAVLLGRGYASNFLLLLWNLMLVASLITRSEFSLKRYLASTPFGVFVLAGLLSFGALSFNVASEAQITNVPWHETSIIKSARARLDWRLDYSPRTETSQHSKTALAPFTKEQVKRTVGGFVPHLIYPYQGEDSPQPNWPLIGLYFFILLAFLVLSLARSDLLTQIRGRKRLIALGMLAGFVWLYPMKNLAAFHNYTHMYNVLLYLLVFAGVFYYFKGRSVVWGFISVAVMLFVLSQWSLYDARIAYNRPENRINRDIDKIRAYLSENELNNVYVDGGHRDLVEGSPYAACLYLSDFKIADNVSEASVILARQTLDKQPLVTGLERLNLYSTAP